jgi:phospholipase/lecithinase/hemolysin
MGKALSRVAWLILVIGGMQFASISHALVVNQMFVFGDSLSDGGNSGLRTQQYTGNPAAVFPPSPYYNGQYSNGPVAVEYLWNHFNPGNTTGFTPSLFPGGGTNYAIGGATTGSANYNTVNAGVPAFLQPAFQGFGAAGELQQFQQYLANGGTFDPATSLFVVWLFPNDVFAAAAGLPAGTVPGSPGGPDLISNGIANILATVQTLAALGAQHVLVPNMPDLGQTPAFRSNPATSAQLSFLTALFNENLGAQLTLFDQFFAGDVVQFDTAAAFRAILDDPAAFGFTNVTDQCVMNLGFGPGECNPTNWNEWVFWDGVHPTTATHRLLGAQFAAAVPEPAGFALVLAALLALALLRRAQRV